MTQKRYRRFIPIAAVLLALTMIAMSIDLPKVARAQDSTTIQLDYDTHARDENAITAQQYGVVYTFNGTEGDVVTIAMVQDSGNLRPIIGLFNPRLPKNKQIIATGKTLPSGKAAVISKFSLPDTGAYLILASREGVDKGKTTGKYSITLLLDSAGQGGQGDQSGQDQTPTSTPVKKATPTKRPKPSATPADEPTPEATDQANGGNASSDSVQSFQVGQSPVFSVWNGSNLFVSNFGDGSVSMLDSDGNSVKTVQVGGQPFAMAWDGSRLWVADVGTSDNPGDSVNLIDKTGKKVGTFKVGQQPFSLSYDKDNKRMWIALYGENKIVAVDAKGKVQTSIDTDTNPNTVLWTGDKLWATLSGPSDKPNNQVIAVDTDGNITGTFKVGKNPADLAWNDTDQVLYVANYDDNSITVLDTDGKSVGTFKPGKQPGALAWDGTHLWVTLGGDKAIEALSNKGKVLTKIPVDAAPNGVTYDGTYVWVANQGTTDQPGTAVTRIDVNAALSQQ